MQKQDQPQTDAPRTAGNILEHYNPFFLAAGGTAASVAALSSTGMITHPISIGVLAVQALTTTATFIGSIYRQRDASRLASDFHQAGTTPANSLSAAAPANREEPSSGISAVSLTP